MTFKRDSFRFLEELGANNERDWFEANKARYESLVREPALGFIREAVPHLARISPHLVASDRKVGGSLMRVYRDTRFSKDKTPYKTNIGIHFRHDAGKDVHAPGLYVHIEPETCFLGVGVWRPDGKALGKIREALQEEGPRFTKILKKVEADGNWKQEGETLKRPPRGIDADHPMVESLKRKDFTLVHYLKKSQVTRADFLEVTFERLKATKAYCKFLCDALELPF